MIFLITNISHGQTHVVNGNHSVLPHELQRLLVVFIKTRLVRVDEDEVKRFSFPGSQQVVWKSTRKWMGIEFMK